MANHRSYNPLLTIRIQTMEFETSPDKLPPFGISAVYQSCCAGQLQIPDFFSSSLGLPSTDTRKGRLVRSCLSTQDVTLPL